VVRTCTSCGQKKSVPARHPAGTGRSGACKASLPAISERIEVDPSQFEEITREARVPVLMDFSAAWCTPIVVNRQEQLLQAFTELREGTFLKSGAVPGA